MKLSSNSIARLHNHLPASLSGVIALLFMAACHSGIGTGSSLSPAQHQDNNSLQTSAGLQGQSSQTEIMQVAVIGDSQSTGGYGQRLSDLIRYASKQQLVYFGAASSARVGSWVSGGFSPIPANAYYGCDSGGVARSCAPSLQSGRRTESISSIMKRNSHADLFILTLGDNHFYDPASIRSELPQLVKPILSSGAKCAFVTPTEGTGRFADKRNLLSNIKSALADIKTQTDTTCEVIDSYSVGADVLKTNTDLQHMRNSVSADPMGLHPQGAGARLWAERVFEALAARGLLTRL
jgi:lysophospholipase L1-like esterase